MKSEDQREVERLRALNQTLVAQLERLALRVLKLEDDLQAARKGKRTLWALPLGRVVEEHERTEAALREWCEESTGEGATTGDDIASELERRGLWRGAARPVAKV